MNIYKSNSFVLPILNALIISIIIVGQTSAQTSQGRVELGPTPSIATVRGEWWVDADAFASLHDALAYIGTSDKTLVIRSNETLLKNDVIPSNVDILFARDGKIIFGDYNLIIEGTVHAGIWSIFHYTGTGKALLQPSSTSKLYVKWWRGDDTEMLQSALDAATLSEATLLITEGVYNIHSILNATVLPDSLLNVRGIGRVKLVSTVPDPSDISGIIHIVGSGSSSLTIDNVRIEDSKTVNGKLNAFHVQGGFTSVKLSNLFATKVSLAGIYLRNVMNVLVENCQCIDNRNAGLEMVSCKNVKVIGGDYSNNETLGNITVGYGVTCASSVLVAEGPNSNVLITGVQSNYNRRKCIDVHCGHNITIDRNFVKGFGRAGIFALNEKPSKDVKDIKIINNFIDGDGFNFQALDGIHIGCDTSTALDSGTFHVVGNTIQNIDGHENSFGIYMQTEGGTQPESVIIANNIFRNGCSSTGGYIVYIKGPGSGGGPIKNAIISHNILHSKSAKYAINIQNALKSAIHGNHITVESGSTLCGIYTIYQDESIITENNLTGGAVYQTAIEHYNDPGVNKIIKNNLVYGIEY